MLSIIVPVYNEKGNIAVLYNELKNVMDKFKIDTEIIFVDDGSTDGTYEELKKMTHKDKQTKLISFSRNYGQTSALSAGIKNSIGKIIIPIDADLQNDPNDIPFLLEKINEGYDVVSGWRKNRKESFLKRILPSKIANFIISILTKVKLHDYGCTLKAYKKEFLQNIAIYGEMHRFLPAYCAWQGAKITEVVVNSRERKYGKSKYGLNRTFKVILDLLVVKFLFSYLSKPIYVFGGMALSSFIASFLLFIFVLVRKIFFHGQWLSPLFFFAFFLTGFSIICFFLGLLAELQTRIYFEARGKDIYKVKETINL